VVIGALAGRARVAAYLICWLAFRATRIPRRCRKPRSAGGKPEPERDRRSPLSCSSDRLLELPGRDVSNRSGTAAELAWALLLIAGGTAVLLFVTPR